MDVSKKYGFPFDIPRHKLLTDLFSCIEIKDIDLSPLIYILEQRFPCFEKVEKNVIEEYAWRIVMDSVSYVWGG